MKQQLGKLFAKVVDLQVNDQEAARAAADELNWNYVALAERRNDPRQTAGIRLRANGENLARTPRRDSVVLTPHAYRVHHPDSPFIPSTKWSNPQEKALSNFSYECELIGIIFLILLRWRNILPIVFDAAEKRILEILQRDTTLPLAQLAEATGLSPSPCWRRVQRLREAGVITAQVALLDRRAIGLNAQVFAQVRLSAQGRENIEEFSSRIREFPEVLECYVMMGSIDFMLRVVAADIDAYERFFFDKLSRVPGIQEINSMVALSQIKATTALPIF